VKEKAMFKRIDHIEIIPRDFDKAICFYTETLIFRLRQQMSVNVPPLDDVAYLALGDTVLELMRVKDAVPSSYPPWQTGYRMMAIEVEDMEQAVAYVAEKGVPITWGPVTMGTTKRAEIKDPMGIRSN
jgi:glyoxylase I family protein